jgi:hypothetical protein
MMEPKFLSYLKTRLAGIACAECTDAVRLIDEAAATAVGDLPIRVERDLCHAVWGCISHALDIADLTDSERLLLDAIESEMAGRVLTARLALGELVKAA